jgi:hypothetical protein
MEVNMYFLPDEEIEITWMRNPTSEMLEGHAWYNDAYCLFESEPRADNEGKHRGMVYKLYALTGQALANELAREKLFELSEGPSRFAKLAPSLAVGLGDRQTPGVVFIGRFVALPSQDRRRAESGRRLQWAQDRIADAIPPGLRAIFSRARSRSPKQNKRVA